MAGVAAAADLPTQERWGGERRRRQVRQQPPLQSLGRHPRMVVLLFQLRQHPGALLQITAAPLLDCQSTGENYNDLKSQINDVILTPLSSNSPSPRSSDDASSPVEATAGRTAVLEIAAVTSRRMSACLNHACLSQVGTAIMPYGLPPLLTAMTKS
jgi:hypothetical protein